MEDTELESPATNGTRVARRIIAIGGGKGGTGKSLIAANVGIFLATLGKRVVLLDADLGGANLHTFLGIDRPQVTIADLFDRRVASINDVIVDTAVPGLGLVSGEGDPAWVANPRPAQKQRLLAQVGELDVDYLVVDLGPGSGLNAIDFFLLADVGALVVVPEPTAVENSYRFLKSAFLRRLRRAGLERALSLVRDGHGWEGGIPAPADLLGAAQAVDPELAGHLFEEMRAFRPRIVVNQVRAKSDAELGSALVGAARRRLGIPVEWLGFLEHDDAAWLAIRKRRPLLIEHPESHAAKGIERIARRLLALENETPWELRLSELVEPTHYELLAIQPTATEEEIRRRHRRVREIYAAESLVVCGLYDRDRLAALHLQLDAAYNTLMDAERRRAYDQRLFPEGLPQRQRTPGLGTPVIDTRPLGEPEPSPAPATPEERPEEPAITAETVFTGPLLRQIRAARGIDLDTIAQKTKIGLGHLRAIEEEIWGRLPAVVYVRGFLVGYARFLHLDVERVVNGYLERLRAARGADRD